MRKAMALLFCISTFAAANIVPPPHPPHPPHPPAPPRPSPKPNEPASIKNLDIKVDINDQVAKTGVTQVFVNPNPRPLEGSFVLPIPKEAQISNFTFYINGKEVEGEILGREKAQKYYSKIVSQLIDPALLEYMDKGLIRIKLFPIPPRGEAKVQFSYTHILKSSGERLTYYYPLGTGKLSSKRLSRAVLDVDITSSVPLRAVYCPQYEIDVVRHGESKAEVSFEKSNFIPEDDLLLYLGRSEKDFGITTVAYKEGEEDGYALFLLSPKQEFGPSGIQPKDIVFVLDTSGSMATGDKLSQAKEALKYCVSSLDEKDRFNIVVFSTTAHKFESGFVKAVSKEKERAASFIEELKAAGGTNIDEALKKALNQKQEESDRPFMVIFLTDGQPTIGVTDKKEILKHVAQRKPENLRLFVFGVGNDVNTVLLDRLAGDNHGTRHYVRPKEDLEVHVSTFYKQIARPVLSGVELSFQKTGVYELYPPDITDIFYGSQVTLAGRYKKPGDQILELSGSCAGNNYSYRFPVHLPSKDGEASYLPRLWATRKIGYLLDEIRLQDGKKAEGEKKELVETVKKLAKRFGIVTPYTSFFVHDDGELARRGDRPRLGAPRGSRPSGRVTRAQGAGGFGYGRNRGGRKGSSSGLTHVNEPQSESGKKAVDRSVELKRLKSAEKSNTSTVTEGGSAGTEGTVKCVGAKTFYLKDGVWVDSCFQEEMKEKEITYLSPEYFELLSEKPALGRYFALGKEVLVCYGGVAYRITQKS